MADNLVLITIALNQVNKLLGIGLFNLTLAHTLDILQLLKGYRIVGGHLFDADILEDDIGRTLQTSGHLLTQIAQHGIQRRIQSTCSTIGIRRYQFVILAKLIILYNHKGLWLLDELLASRCQLQQSIVLYVFLQIACYQGLADDGVPMLLLHILASTEQFVILMFMGNYLLRLMT